MLHFSDSNLPTLKNHQQKRPSKALSAFSPGERSWSPPSRVASQPRCSSNRWGLAHSNSPTEVPRGFGRSKILHLFSMFPLKKFYTKNTMNTKIQRSHETESGSHLWQLTWINFLFHSLDKFHRDTHDLCHDLWSDFDPDRSLSGRRSNI